MKQRLEHSALRERLLDVAAGLVGALALGLAFPAMAEAYVDPSVVTYTIQAVAGVAVALGAVLGVAFRRTRRVLYKVLKIDVNANKIVDPNVHFLEGRESEITVVVAGMGADAGAEDESSDAGEEGEAEGGEGAEPETEPEPEPEEPEDPEARAATAILATIPYVIIENYDARELYAKRIVPPGGMPAENIPPEELDEPDLSALVTPEVADQNARELKELVAHGKPPRKLRWPLRLLLSLAASAFTIATIFIFTPLELVAASTDSLTFGFFDVSDLIITVGIVAALVLAFALSLVRGRVFDVLLCVLVAIGLGCFVQALFLNEQLPVADGHPFDLGEYADIVVIDTIVWVALFAGLLVFNAKKRPLARVFLPFLSVLLLVVQIVSMAGVMEEERQELATRPDPLVMSTYGINEVGAAGDVTVFVLDTFDTKVMDWMLQYDPTYLDEFTGFTWFRNSTGSLIPTRYAIPFMLTNVMPEPGETYDGYEASVYDRGTLLADINDAGYEVTVYSDSVDPKAIDPYVANIFPVHQREFDERQLYETLERMALFREMPWLLKPFFWFYTSELNANALDGYNIDDAAYGATLAEEGLSISEKADRTFRFIHLSGIHYPYTLDENGQRHAEVTSVEQQAEGVMGFVDNYLQELKRLGLYDQSTIIVTADHGDWYLTDKPLEEATTPILLVKPAETPEQAAQPLQISQVPTGHLDLAATIIGAMGGDSAKYGPTVFEVQDGPRDRYYWMTTHDGHTDYDWYQYVIQGDVLDFWNSWHLTGNMITIGEPAPAPDVNGEFAEVMGSESSG